MAKRLTRTDYIFTLIFIFMLFCVIAAFFYGLKTGKENSDLKYEKMQKQVEVPLELTAYHQQYLVSFYHTIYLPYRDFQTKWFEQMEFIELRRNTIDPESVFKELKKLADKQYDEMVYRSMPETSPLLQESHKDFLKSLKLFSEALKRFQINNMQGLELISEIDKDIYFQEAKQFSLSGVYNYYNSILQWNRSMDPLLKEINLTNDTLNIEGWNQLNLNQKNSYIAYLFKENSYYKAYYLQDMTIKVDELIQSGQAEKMKLDKINKMVETLVNTGAVRPDDFIRRQNIYYQDELLPQLPFFFEQK